MRNADDFRQRLNTIRGQYDLVFKPLLDKIRNELSEDKRRRPPEVDLALEIHKRTYFVNGLLIALNWRLDREPGEGLPNIVPEAAIESAERGTRRYMDYLGFEQQTLRPLLIVETKRPSSSLPELSQDPSKLVPSEVIAKGLMRDPKPLSGEWNTWLNDLKDYVLSTLAKTKHFPQRVVITNGNWLILLKDPEQVFSREDDPNPARILVFESIDDLISRYAELFAELEHQLVLGEAPALTPGELGFHVEIDSVNMISYGLRLKYIEQASIYEVFPAIHVAPLVFVRTRFNAWFRVESPPRKFELPHRSEDLVAHLDEVKHAANNLLTDVQARLALTLNPSSIRAHYQDEGSFESHPGVRSIGENEFVLMTGNWTHYLGTEPSLSNCIFHDWAGSQAHGVAANPGPIMVRSIHPRSFFVSGEQHHCSHRDVDGAKASRITEQNRPLCGSRSGENEAPFCEVWKFEQHLCCRTCVFEEVCTSAKVFHLPCAAKLVQVTT